MQGSESEEEEQAEKNAMIIYKNDVFSIGLIEESNNGLIIKADYTGYGPAVSYRTVERKSYQELFDDIVCTFSAENYHAAEAAEVLLNRNRSKIQAVLDRQELERSGQMAFAF